MSEAVVFDTSPITPANSIVHETVYKIQEKKTDNLSIVMYFFAKITFDHAYAEYWLNVDRVITFFY